MKSELPDGWQKASVTSLGAIAGGPFGSSLGRKDYVDAGVPVIRGGNLGTDARFDSTEFVFVSDDKADSLHRNIALPGDVVFTQRGTLGQVGIVPQDGYPRYVISQSQMRLRVDPEVADPDFVYATFRSPMMIRQIENRAISVGVPHINLGILGELEVPLPPLPEQRRIAAVLRALDAKIEHAGRISARLAEVPRTLFGHHFGQAIGDTRLAEVALVTRGRSYKSTELNGEDIALVTLKSFLRGGGYSPRGLKPYSGPYKPEQEIEPGNLVIAQTDLTQAADVIGRPALVPDRAGYKTLVASLDVGVVRPTSDQVSVLWLYELMRTTRFIANAKAHANGSTVLHLGKHAVPEYRIQVPEAKALSEFESVARPVHARIAAIGKEANRLREVRAALLPRLVSGSTRTADDYVSDVDEPVAA